MYNYLFIAITFLSNQARCVLQHSFKEENSMLDSSSQSEMSPVMVFQRTDTEPWESVRSIFPVGARYDWFVHFRNSLSCLNGSCLSLKLINQCRSAQVSLYPMWFILNKTPRMKNYVYWLHRIWKHQHDIPRWKSNASMYALTTETITTFGWIIYEMLFKMRKIKVGRRPTNLLFNWCVFFVSTTFSLK